MIFVLKFITIAISSIALLYMLVVIAVFFLQEKLIFPGDRLPTGFTFRKLPGLEEKSVAVESGSLSALHFRNEAPRGLIFFLHGNAGNLDSWVPDTDFYERERYDMFMIDYRGYGKSTGRIQSQKQLEADVLAAWKSVAPEYHAKELPIVIYGRSLGTYLATNLASKVDADLLALVSPYTSITDMAKRTFPWIPTQGFLKYPLATRDIISQIEIPVILLHGTEDSLIPPAHAHALHDIALLRTHPTRYTPNEFTQLKLIEHAGHADIHEFAQYEDALAAALPDKEPLS